MSTSSADPKQLSEGSSASESASSAAEQYIERQLNRTRVYVKIVELCGALMTWVLAILLTLLTTAIIDAWIINLGGAARLTILVGLVAGSLYFFARHVLPLLFRAINPLYAAHVIEESQPRLKNSLINFLFVRREATAVRRSVRSAIESRAAQDLRTVPVESAVDRSRLIWFGYALVAVVTLAGLYKVFSPKDPFQTVIRIAAPLAEVPPPATVKIRRVNPGDATVFFGEALEVSAEVRGLRDQQPVRLMYTTVDGRQTEVPVSLRDEDGDGVYTGKLATGTNGIQQGLTYRLEAGDARTTEFQVTVRSRPTLVIEELTYDYPDYTDYPDRTEQGGSDLTAIEGTRIRLRAKANLPIARATIELLAPAKAPTANSDDDRPAASPNELRVARQVKMKVDGDAASGDFLMLLQSDRLTPKYSHFRVRFYAASGERNERPAEYQLQVIPDLAPEVEFLEPTQSAVQVALDRSLMFRLRALDPDFQVSRLLLQGEQQGQRRFELDLLNDAAEPSQSGGRLEVAHRWVPAEHGLQAGDQLVIRGVAYDNRQSPVSGLPDPNSATTSNIIVEIVPPVGGRDPLAPKTEPSGDSSSAGEQGRAGESGSTEAGESGSSGEPSSGQDAAAGEQAASGADEQATTGQQEATSSADESSSNTGETGQAGDSSSSSQSGETQSGETQSGETQSGETQSGQTESGQTAAGQQSGEQTSQQAGEPSGQAGQSGESQSGSQTGSSGSGGESSGSGATGESSGAAGQGTSTGSSNSTGAAGDAASDASSSGQSQAGQGGEPTGTPPEQGPGSGAGESGNRTEGTTQQPGDPSNIDQNSALETGAGSESGPGSGTESTSEDLHDGEAFERLEELIRERQQQEGASSDPTRGGESGSASQEAQSAAGEENMGDSSTPPAGGESSDASSGTETGAGAAGQQAGASGDPQQTPTGDTAGGAEEGAGTAGNQGEGGESASQRGNGKGDSGESSQSSAGTPADEGKPGGDSTGRDTTQPSQSAGQQETPGSGGQDRPGQPGSRAGEQNRGDASAGESQESTSQPDQSSGADAGTAADQSAAKQSGGDPAGLGQAGQQPAGSQSSSQTGTDPSGSQTSGSDAAGSDATGSDATGSDASGDDRAGSGSDSAQGTSDSQTSSSEAGKESGSTGDAGESSATDPGTQSEAGADPAESTSGQSREGAGDSSGATGEASSSGNNQSNAPAGGESGANSNRGGEAPGDGARGDQSSASEAAGESGRQDNASSSAAPSSSGGESSSLAGNEGTAGEQSRGEGESSRREGQPAGSGRQPTGGRGNAGEGTSTPSASGELTPEEKANLEYTRETTDLVLDYLKEQKENPDSKLLEEMNWTEQDLESFVERWEAMKRRAETGSPQDRRLWDERLRSLGLRPGPDRRVRSDFRADQVEGLQQEGTRSRPPAEFLEQFRAFQRGASRTEGQPD